jgi:hypothetical protein
VSAASPFLFHVAQIRQWIWPELRNSHCAETAAGHDLRTDTITIPQTGTLGPMSSTHGDTTLYNNTGWSRCWNQSALWTQQQRLLNAKTCWEHFDPQLFLSFIETQGGPGGTLQVDNEDMIGDDQDPSGCGSQVRCRTARTCSAVPPVVAAAASSSAAASSASSSASSSSSAAAAAAAAGDGDGDDDGGNGLWWMIRR